MKLLYKYSYGEESYGLVYENSDRLFEVWEIPQYGGEERYCETLASFDEAKQLAESYT